MKVVGALCPCGCWRTWHHILQFEVLPKEKIGIAIIVSCFQKTVINETAFILRRVLGNSEVR